MIRKGSPGFSEKIARKQKDRRGRDDGPFSSLARTQPGTGAASRGIAAAWGCFAIFWRRPFDGRARRLERDRWASRL